MLSVVPSIDPAIAALAPGFRALSITVEAAPIVDPGVAAAALARACRAVSGEDAPWAEAHLAAWAEAFKSFGAKPKRTPCSAEALRKRVLRDGDMPSIDPVVDLYNAVSIRYAVPVGGENIAAYVGEPKLLIAEGTELFDTVKEGETAHESPEPGEVIWRDDLGVTCRRWNWRQGVRTRLSAEASRMWFILESLPAMPLDALHAAGDELIDGLRLMMPGAAIDKKLIGFDLAEGK
ncbi:B3/4 domain [Serratia entomophila]|uniref:B3/B4 domain-containing protein n=1 Tax=Serratia entomophila TaxID=42906 RepID=UPI002177F95F|nr:B3/4 domain-containing protein [Serratia entomophila]CAI1079452.1 B3/4 domain [Serratia entomophila]CAI1879592.1 B3/4 domain [Serratia entomophila]CAI1906648.1 B3/4 domain [Serratia entomophila]CAI1951852.1 B3/4 domain [Serratia entomophila]